MSVVYVSIVIICIIVIAYQTVKLYKVNKTQSKYNEQLVYGYYVGDPAFCETAGCSSIQIFIGHVVEEESDSKNNVRRAHLLINNDIANTGLKITYPKKPKTNTLEKYSFDAELEFEEKCDIATDCTFEFDMKNRMLRIYDDTTVYGIFYKDNEITKLLS